jgi:hypothetical protein
MEGMLSTPRFLLLFALMSVPLIGQVKTKLYVKEPGPCAQTYRLDKGRVLTSKGLIEDPTVNEIMERAIAKEMNGRRIRESAGKPDLIFRFMGGTGAGLQIDDPTAGDMMVWNIGGTFPTSSKYYKKSALFIAAVDGHNQQTIWAAKCSDKFGDPARLEERINKAVTSAFKKLPAFLTCR